MTAIAPRRSLPLLGRDVLVAGAIGLAERGWLPDAVLRAGIRHLIRERLEEQQRRGSTTAGLAERLKRMPIALAVATANQQHYEVPPEFFARVLGPRLKYSCGYWPNDRTTLADAEEAMLALTAERAGIEDGMAILELGCGWGSLTLWIAERFPASRIVAVSNSHSQRAFIEGRASEAGVRNVTIVTCDMNHFDTKGRFDRVVSVEMFEHMRNYELLLARIASWLSPAGKLFVQVFAHRRHAYPFEDEGQGDWMARHFFTSGLMPSEDLLLQFQRDLVLEEQWRLAGTHYERTSNAWLANLDAHRDAILPVLARTYPAGSERLWLQRWRIFFLACAEMFGFRNGTEWGVAHYRLRQRGRA
jgi:cyclopropane-fatty-acyl-phospholipid synthase